MKMRKWAFLGLLLAVVYIPVLYPAYSAETGQPSNKELLQKGLTIFEIDQELQRIEAQETELQSQIASAENNLASAEAASREARVHAAKVIRAYYMGDRDSLWTLLFAARSFSDGLATLEYLQMIIRNDKLALGRHQEAWKQQSQIKQSLDAASASLQQAKQRYIEQRAKLMALQDEVDRQLASQEVQAVSLQQQMLDLNRLWYEQGLPQFKTYFRELARAMQDLPEIMSGKNGAIQSNKISLFDNGLHSTFQLTDAELNDYLRSKNTMFQNLTFHFLQDQVIASGSHEGIELSVKGTYMLATKETGGSKKPYIRFRIDELQFNGFLLPDTTVESLEKEIDLSIYPEKLAPYLQVTEVKLEEGKLKIIFKLLF